MSKKRNIQKEVDDFMKSTPFRIRIQVAIQDHFGVTPFVPANEGPLKDQVENDNKLAAEQAAPIIKLVMEEFNKWKEDGSPE